MTTSLQLALATLGVFVHMSQIVPQTAKIDLQVDDSCPLNEPVTFRRSCGTKRLPIMSKQTLIPPAAANPPAVLGFDPPLA